MKGGFSFFVWIGAIVLIVTIGDGLNGADGEGWGKIGTIVVIVAIVVGQRSGG